MDLAPARCVVFEDAPSGVQAAKAAGSACIAVTNSASAEELAGADLVCASLEQIDLATLRSLVDRGSNPNSAVARAALFGTNRCLC